MIKYYQKDGSNMKNLTAQDLERRFTVKQFYEYNQKLKNQLSALHLEYAKVLRLQNEIIQKEVKIQTKDLTEKLKDKDKIIDEKDKEIEALKAEIVKMQMKMDNDSTNSGLPTSKTTIGKRKYIPNTREKTDKNKGGQKGHPKHKLEPFNMEEITETLAIIPTECNKCHSSELEQLNSSIDKQELDYEVKVIKRNNKFVNCRCKKCGNEFHVNIPNDLKENIQYGKTIQALAVCLTNEIYTPFNKTVKLISGITDGAINMSEGYVTKLQKRASKQLEKFIEEVKEYIPKQAIYGWDDGVISIGQKEGILRVYCTDDVVLFVGHEKKNEDGLKQDGILEGTGKNTIVMHDHIIHNYNDKYNFENVECVIHLIRRLKKKYQETNHAWCNEMIELLSKTSQDRNKLMKENKECFDKKYLDELEKKYDKIIEKGIQENEDKTQINYFEKEEKNFIKDLIKYSKNYLLWAYHFELPSTNNNCERNIRPVKSKMKISGQFQNINYAKYYANIRSYIETCKKNKINIIDACRRLMIDKPYTLEEILTSQKN